jgi:hypothetical protein
VIALLSFFLTLFASPNGDRLFFILMAKNREFSRPKIQISILFRPRIWVGNEPRFLLGLSF